MSKLIQWGAAFIVALFEQWMAKLRRERELRAEGSAETIKKAGAEADDRKKTATDSDAEWAGLSPADRERLRNEHGHYRD